MRDLPQPRPDEIPQQREQQAVETAPLGLRATKPACAG